MKSPKKKIWRKIAFLGLILVLGLFLVLDQAILSYGREDKVPPRVPRGLALKQAGNNFELTWEKSGDWDLFSYVVLVRTAEETKALKQILAGTMENYTLQELKPRTNYFVSLAARDISGNQSQPTPEIGFFTAGTDDKDFVVNAYLPQEKDAASYQAELENNLELFETIFASTYIVEADGRVTLKNQSLSAESLKLFKDQGLKVFATFGNSADVENRTTKIFLDKKKTSDHLAVILKETQAKDYAGVEIAYTNLKGGVKNEFTAFVKDLALKLHEKNKTLILALPPKLSDDDPLAGAYDYQALGGSADEVRIITTDYHNLDTAPGPIAPLKWFKEVLTYAKARVPAAKVFATLPLYGTEWCVLKKDEASCEKRALSYTATNQIMREKDPLLEWNPEASAPWFLYVDAKENTKVINFENHQSVEAKVQAVKDMDLAGVSLVNLGGDDPENLGVLWNKLKVERPLPREFQLKPLDGKIELSWKQPAKARLRGYRFFLNSKDKKEAKHIDVFEGADYTFSGVRNGEVYFITASSLKIGAEYALESALEAEQKGQSWPIAVTPADLGYPGEIADLKVEKVSANAVDLSYTLPGDDHDVGKVERLELRFAEKMITAENYDEAQIYPVAPPNGEPKQKKDWQVRDLVGGKTYYFVLKAFDEAGNVSDLSNVVTAKTVDLVAPKMPKFSAVTPKDKTIDLAWQPIDEFDLGGYEIYFKQEKEAYRLLRVSKDVHNITLSNLENNYQYYLSIAAFDVNGNKSGRSVDVAASPRPSDFARRVGENTVFEKEKIKGSLYLFGKKLVSAETAPYLALTAALVLNILLYYSFREEIKNLLLSRESFGDKVKLKPKISQKWTDASH